MVAESEILMAADWQFLLRNSVAGTAKGYCLGTEGEATVLNEHIPKRDIRLNHNGETAY